MEDIQLEDKDFHVWVLLDRTRRLINKLRRKELKRYGISVPEAAVLFLIQAIAKHGSLVTPAELSRWMVREPHSVSGILQRMVKKGFVIKRNSCLDRKNLVTVTLTEKGKSALRGAVERKSIHEVMSSLSDGEREQLMSLLDKLRGKTYNRLDIETKPPFP